VRFCLSSTLFVTQTTHSRPPATSLYEIAELLLGFLLPFSSFLLPPLSVLGCCCPLGAAAMRRSPTAADLFLHHNALKQVNSKGEADEEYQDRRPTHYTFVRHRVVEVVTLVLTWGAANAYPPVGDSNDSSIKPDCDQLKK
jgi:hypothetical protein